MASEPSSDTAAALSAPCALWTFPLVRRQPWTRPGLDAVPLRFARKADPAESVPPTNQGYAFASSEHWPGFPPVRTQAR
jgi:hypothetical protein